MRIVVGIPVRMGSTRYPGKPLCSILGKSMVEHVYKRCQLSSKVTDVFVAGCDDQIKDVVEGFGGNVYMTPKASHNKYECVLRLIIFIHMSHSTSNECCQLTEPSCNYDMPCFPRLPLASELCNVPIAPLPCPDAPTIFCGDSIA